MKDRIGEQPPEVRREVDPAQDGEFSHLQKPEDQKKKSKNQRPPSDRGDSVVDGATDALMFGDPTGGLATEAVGKGLGGITRIGKKAIEAAGDATGGLGDVVSGAGEIAGNVASGLGKAASGLGDAAGTVAEGLGHAASSIGDVAGSAGEIVSGAGEVLGDIIGGIADGL